MSVQLDSRSHHDLTNEARTRIAAILPELRADGDPGETLIELFAWMTGLAIERLGRVPDKLHVALLDMLGIELRPPAPARADVRIRLSAPAQRPLNIRDGTEIGTVRTATEDSIVFHVQEDFAIAPLRPAAYVVERAGAAKEIGVADGVGASPRAGPDPLRPAAQGRRRALSRVRAEHRAPARAGLDRGLDGARRRGQARGSTAALGGEPGPGRVDRGRRARRPDRRLQLRLREHRASVPVRLRGGAGGRPAAALAALPDRRNHARDRPDRRLPARARDLPDHRRPDRRAAWPPSTRRSRSPSRLARATGSPGRRSPSASRPSSNSPPARRSRSRRRPATGSRGSRSSRSPTPARRIATSRSTSSTG